MLTYQTQLKKQLGPQLDRPAPSKGFKKVNGQFPKVPFIATLIYGQKPFLCPLDFSLFTHTAAFTLLASLL